MSPARPAQKRRSSNRGPIAWKDGTACLVCGSHADVKPIYGDKLPGCALMSSADHTDHTQKGGFGSSGCDRCDTERGLGKTPCIGVSANKTGPSAHSDVL